MKRAIVNLVSYNPRYLFGQRRLAESLTRCNDGSFDTFMLVGEGSVGSPPHLDNPYAFKVYAIEHVKKLGYDQVLWLDASVVAVKNTISPIWKHIDEIGFFFEEAGHLAGSWCNDRTLQYFNITREAANLMPMYSAGMTGIDFTNETASLFFDKWKQSMLDGQFCGSWKDHRHDMTCASIIANQMGLASKYSSGGTYFAYSGPGYSAPAETVLFHLVGL